MSNVEDKELREKQKKRQAIKSPQAVDNTKYPVFLHDTDPIVKDKLLIVQGHLEDVRTQLNSLELTNQKVTKSINADLQTHISRAERILLEILTNAMTDRAKTEKLQCENGALKEQINFITVESNIKFNEINNGIECMNKNLKKLENLQHEIILKNEQEQTQSEKEGVTKVDKEIQEVDRIYKIELSNTIEYTGDWKNELKNEMRSRKLKVAVRDMMEYKDGDGDDILAITSDEKTELDKIVDFIDDDADLNKKIWHSLPHCRQHKIILLGMIPNLSAEEIKYQISESLKHQRPYRHNLELIVYKRYQRKDDMENTIVMVDSWTMRELLRRRKICIEYVRVRAVKFINLIRCYKCQLYGHMSQKCGGEIACAKCGEQHDIKNCTSEKTHIKPYSQYPTTYVKYYFLFLVTCFIVSLFLRY